MNLPPVHIFVNGIEYDLAKTGWVDQAVRWCNLRGIPSAAYEYHTGFWSRWIKQPPYWTGIIGSRAWGLVELIEQYDRPVLVGHSNGCDLICRALRVTHQPVRSAHLFAAATPSDCCTNGLNDAIRRGAVDHVYLYGSPNDFELAKLAKWSRWITGGVLGYGSLGATGPTNQSEMAKQRITPDWRPEKGHGDWLHGEALDLSLRAITRYEALTT